MTDKQRNAHKAPKRLTFAAIVIIFIAAVIVALKLISITNLHKQVGSISAPSNGGASTYQAKGGTQDQQPATNTPTNPSQPGDNKSDVGGGASISLTAPTGNFVSNHTPGKNGSALTESSVCSTSPGASCQITFVKDSLTKQLEAQITDRSGATYWNSWTPSSIGLTAGSWQIKAIASFGGQTKTTIDSINLEVL